MITEVTGSIFDADVEVLVNPVNCVGVMGKGLAKQFKEKYSEYYKSYKKACSRGAFELGRVALYSVSFHGDTPWIICSFPTKYHWEDSSTVDSITSGLKDLKSCIEWIHIRSIAIPALGCGLGGLDWKEVKPLIYEILGNLQDIRILLYPPQEN